MYFFSIIKIIIHLFLLRPFIKLYFGVNIFGRENICNLDRFIIISNHNSHIDILLLFYLLPINKILNTRAIAAKEYFSKSKVLFFLVNYLFNPIWVTRGGGLSKFWDDVNNALDKGENLIIFPEGSRGLPGKIKSFKGGIGKISKMHRNTPIIPVFISGTEKSYPRNTYIPIPIWNNLTISPPQLFDGTPKEITQILQSTIKELADNEKLFHHKREMNQRKSMKTIAFLGIDGSGKSTLSKNISKMISNDSSIALVSDKLEFYKDGKIKSIQPFITDNIRKKVSKIAKNAKSLKLYKIPKLIELLLRDILLLEIKKWYNQDSVVLDGSPLLNLTAWAILYKEKFFNEEICLKAIKILSSRGNEVSKSDQIYKDFPELLYISKLGFTHLNLPDIVIFLDIEPKIAIDRIDNRGEKKQVHETIDKLAKLREAYIKTCSVIQNDFKIPVYILSGNDTIENISNSAYNFIKKIEGNQNEK